MRRLWVFQTNEQAFLDDCQRFATYGVPRPQYKQVREASDGDYVLLRLKLKGRASGFVYSGPYRIASGVPPWVSRIEEKVGVWCRVNPSERGGPRWLMKFPWCVFLEKTEEFIEEPRSLGVTTTVPACEAIVDPLASEILQNLLQDEYLPRSTRDAYRTTRGVWVRSRGEYMIDNWFSSRGIVTYYERSVYLDAQRVVPDWFLPRIGLFVEFLGLKGQPDYDRRWAEKERLYRKHELRFVALDETDLTDLDVAIPRKIPKILDLGVLA